MLSYCKSTVYPMKTTKSPEGKIYTIDRQTAKTLKVPIPAVYYGHMVLVLGSVPNQRDHVRIVTVSIPDPKFSGFRSHLTQITSSVDPNVDWSDYLPIYPSRKNQRTKIQLHLRSSFEQWTELYQRSYVRVDTECIVPIQVLKRTPEEGLQFELQSKSRQAVQWYLHRCSMQAALVQVTPIVHMQTVMEEAEAERGPSSGAADWHPCLQSSSTAEM